MYCLAQPWCCSTEYLRTHLLYLYTYTHACVCCCIFAMCLYGRGSVMCLTGHLYTHIHLNTCTPTCCTHIHLGPNPS